MDQKKDLTRLFQLIVTSSEEPRRMLDLAYDVIRIGEIVDKPPCAFIDCLSRIV